MLLACAVAIPTIGDPSSFLTEQYPLMFVKYHDVAVTLSSSLEELCEEMARQYNIPGFSAPNVIGETCYTCGRILPNPDGLNADNLWFQTSGQFGAAMCRLDIGLVKNCALFPGQVIVAKGISNGKVFSASEIFTGAPPRLVKLALPEKDTLHILAACGPFNLAGESQPEPLKDFIGYVIDTKPDLVIFMGPFVDETLARNEEFMNETTFENQFKSVMHFIFAQIPENLHIPIIVVPSAGQLVGVPVYPVPRFTMTDCVENAVAFAKSDVTRLLTFEREPALLNINGIVVGLTSTDILSHLYQHERRWRCNGQSANTSYCSIGVTGLCQICCGYYLC
ncbi:DNA polymerase alpha subunit B-like [Paramacrobiotus metropolitanus]|uniref:DNA polymerase alpha subunit B-like n=1 Tax=Paramacrobiotus metropolitanus TaxID=2943436 RepID=UPI0024459DF9|nr:DNA polymerase alpha subunit B-like [Paramacrobiotus metropolitanus]